MLAMSCHGQIFTSLAKHDLKVRYLILGDDKKKKMMVINWETQCLLTVNECIIAHTQQLLIHSVCVSIAIFRELLLFL